MLRVQHSMAPRCAAYPSYYSVCGPLLGAQACFFCTCDGTDDAAHQSIAGELEMRNCSLQKTQYVTILPRDGSPNAT